MLTSVLKPKACHICKREFLPRSSFATCCSQRCAMKKVRADKASEKAADRERKRALKTIPDLIKEAQREFNGAIRERDKDKPCISCGRALRNGGNTSTGGDFDCGHFRSTGSAPHLRFDPRNAHGQCKHCNRYLAGNAVSYRAGLIERIGIEEVESLEANNAVRKWGRDELIALREANKAWRKELQRG